MRSSSASVAGRGGPCDAELRGGDRSGWAGLSSVSPRSRIGDLERVRGEGMWFAGGANDSPGWFADGVGWFRAWNPRAIEFTM